MAEIYINANIVEDVIKSYSDVDKTFVFRTYFDAGNNKKRLSCFINGKECKVDFYFKTDNKVNILPVGANSNESNKLISYICSKGHDATVAATTCSFACSLEIVNSLQKYLSENFREVVSIEKYRENIFKIKGYHNDTITLTFYPTKNKVLIQGKPLQVYHIVLTYLASIKEIPFETIVDISNSFNGTAFTSQTMREEIKRKIGDKVYIYLDEVLLKTLSSTLSALKQVEQCEDYSVCLLGVFKTLEGYLTKVLEKYNYRIENYPKFSMFHKTNGRHSRIDNDAMLSNTEKICLNKLYCLYSKYRNVFLHTTADVSQTAIISTLQEAKNISDEILDEISTSHKVFF